MRLADHDQTLTFRAWSWRGIHGTDYLPASFRASATFRCRVITLTFDLLDHRASARVGDESSYSIRFPSLTFVGRPSRFEDRVGLSLIFGRGVKRLPTSKWGHGQWRSKVESGPCAKIPKGTLRLLYRVRHSSI